MYLESCLFCIKIIKKKLLFATDPVIILIKVASICANKNPQLNWNFHSILFISNARNTRAAARLRVSCGVRVHIAHAAISGDYGCVLGAMRLCHGRS